MDFFDHLILPKPVLYLIKTIMDHGGEAYLVGGALRDICLNREVKDYDVATSLHPSQIEEIFSDRKTYPIGKRFGTITAIIDDLSIEVTTFRGEKDYTDLRHPDHICFVLDIRDDLSRRDFTINAMAFNPYVHSKLIDPHSGIKDLDKRIVRTVGDPSQRFNEDPLRMMRGIRFCAQLDFELEKNTYSSIKSCHYLLSKISAERVRDELLKILMSSNVDKGIIILDQTGILGLILRLDSLDTKSPVYCLTLPKHEYSFLKSCPKQPAIRLCALLCHVLENGSSQAYIKGVLRGLRCDNNFIKRVLNLYNGYKFLAGMEITPYNARRLLGQIEQDDMINLLQWYRVYTLTSPLDINTDIPNRINNAENMLHDILEHDDPVKLSDLAIDGNDILEVGIGKNNIKLVGEALQTAYHLVLQDPTLNKKELLLDTLKREYTYIK